MVGLVDWSAAGVWLGEGLVGSRGRVSWLVGVWRVCRFGQSRREAIYRRDRLVLGCGFDRGIGLTGGVEGG